MKLVFIYGPPAVGKLTVANVLSEKINIPVFHNHYTFDIGELLYPKDVKKGGKLASELRIEVFRSAVENNVDLIFTYVYGAGIDDKHIQRVIKAVTGRGGEIHFVRLTTTKDELYKRVVDPSRKGTKKLKTKEGLAKIIEKYNLFDDIPDGNSLMVNNTNISPEEVASKIIKHYKLS